MAEEWTVNDGGDYGDSLDLSGYSSKEQATQTGVQPGEYHLEISQITEESGTKETAEGEKKQWRNKTFHAAILDGHTYDARTKKNFRVTDAMKGQKVTFKLFLPTGPNDKTDQLRVFALRLGLVDASAIGKANAKIDWEKAVGTQCIGKFADREYQGRKSVDLVYCGVYELDDPSMSHVPLDMDQVELVGMTAKVKKARAGAAKEGQATGATGKPAGNGAAASPAPAAQRPAGGVARRPDPRRI